MKITEKDVGRKVRLRNGEEVEISHIQGTIYNLMFATLPHKRYCYDSSGKYLGDNVEFDIVSFLLEQPTSYVSIHEIF